MLSVMASLLPIICLSVVVAHEEEQCSLKKVKLDAIFVIDGSWSIDPEDFKMGNYYTTFSITTVDAF